MYPSVLTAFRKFTVDREGDTDFMYADRKNWVTTGIGNKIDDGQTEHSTAFRASDYAPALRLPWRHKPRRPGAPRATPQEIANVWQLVKARIDLNPRGGMIYDSLPGNDLYLDETALQNLVAETLSNVEGHLKNLYPNFDRLPADAQLGLVSMAWAMGTGRMAASFPKFNAAIRRGDFVTAARESHMVDANDDRNDGNRDLFLNAAAVVATGADPSRVYFPATVTGAAKGGMGIAGLGLAVGIGTAAWYLLKRWA